MADEVNLGDHVRDNITGFEGIVVARTEWLNQCRRVGIQPEKLSKEGVPIEPQWFDEPQVTIIRRATVQRPIALTGGPKKAPPRIGNR